MASKVLINSRITVDPESVLRDEGELVKAISAASGRALKLSRSALLADGRGDSIVRAHPVEIAWTGPAVAQVPGPVRARFEAQIRTALSVTTKQADIHNPSQLNGTVRPTSKRPWVVKKSVNFRARTGDFLNFLEGIGPLPERVLFEGEEERVRWVLAWLVEVNRPYVGRELAKLLQERAERMSRMKLSESIYYGWGTSEVIRKGLISIDQQGIVKRAIPDLWTRNYRRVEGNGESAFVHQGGWVLFAAMVLPEHELLDVAIPEPEIQVKVKLRDLTFLVPIESFEQEFNISWQAYVQELGEEPATLRLWPITIYKSMYFKALRFMVGKDVNHLLDNESLSQGKRLARCGEMFVLNNTALNRFPTVAKSQMESLTNDTTLRLHDISVQGELGPGWRAVFAFATIDLNSDTISAARYRPEARRLVIQLRLLLNGDPRDFDWRWNLIHFFQNNFGEHPPDERPDGGTLFEFVLEELNRQSNLNMLFERVEAADHGILLGLVVRHSLATCFAAHERVRRSAALRVERFESGRKNLYADKFVVLERNPDCTVKVGEVFGDVDSIYIFKREEKQLKPARLTAFREAMLSEGQALIGRILRGEDTNQYSEEDFARSVMGTAVQRIGLNNDDFEDVTVERSMRLLRVEARTKDALPRHYITIEFVDRIAGKEWQSISLPITERTEIDDDFEARLIYWRLGRAGEVWKAFGIGVTAIGLVLIAWEAGIVAVLVNAAGGATTVLVSIGISELIYILRVVFGDTKLTLRGFLEAALDGYLMALGFRGAGILGRTAAKAIGTESLKHVIGGWVTERLIVGTVGGAGTAALTTLSHDLINIATGKGGFSSLRQYVSNMTLGAAVGIAFEFVGAPVLKSVGGTALEGLTNAVELAKLIRVEGIGAVRWTALVTEGLGNLQARLRTVMGDVAAKGFIRAMGERLAEVTQQMGGRFVSGRVLELAEVSLTSSAKQGLEKFLNAAELNPSRAVRVFNALADNPQQAITFLEVVNGLEVPAIQALLNGTFSGSVSEMASFLSRLSRYSATQQSEVVRILLELEIEAGAPTARGRGQELIQRQFAASLRIKSGVAGERAEALKQQAAAMRGKAKLAESSNLERAERLYKQADSLEEEAAELLRQSGSLHLEAERVTAGQKPTPVLPGPEDLEQLFEQARVETWIRIPLDEIERHPESIERLARLIFRSRSGNRVVFRVEGGASPHARSHELINISEGHVQLANETLNVNFGVFERAIEFLIEHRPGARLKVFEIEEAWFESLRSSAIPERGVRVDPSLPKLKDVQGAPRNVDVRFGEDQLQIPPELIKELKQFIVPNSGRVVEFKGK